MNLINERGTLVPGHQEATEEIRPVIGFFIPSLIRRMRGKKGWPQFSPDFDVNYEMSSAGSFFAPHDFRSIGEYKRSKHGVGGFKVRDLSR